ncbi:hypothetical protein ABS768_02065, partial [Flavobacterium sp. ST-75]
MKYFYSKLKFCLTGFFMIGLFLLAGEKANSQTTLSPGDILFTGFDATYSPSNGDAFSFVLLKDITSGTVISFTDRGYFGGSSWQSVSTISSESDITWTSSSALSLGTQIYIKGLTASVFDPSGGTYTPNGTVLLTNGTSSNGLNLSAVGDEIIAYQGGSGSVTGSGVTIIAGINYYYCVGGTNSTAVWNIGCDGFVNASQMPPGLTGGFDAYFTGAISGNDTPDAAYFSCTGGSLSTASQIRTAVMNPANWVLSATTVTLPNTCTFGGTPPPPPPTVTNPVNVYGCLNGNTSLSVTATDADTYQWQISTNATTFSDISNGGIYSGATTATLNLTGLTSSVNQYFYRCVVSNTSGTATSSFTTVSVFTANITHQSDVSCYGGSDGGIQVYGSSGVPPYTFVWSTGPTTINSYSNSNTLGGLPAGTYSVTITDGNGCTATASTTLTQPTTAVSTTTVVNSNATCGSYNGQATTTPTGGNPPYHYEWSDGGTGAINYSLPAGTHTVIVYDSNNCSFTDTVTITANDTTAPVANVATLPTITAQCEVTAGTITAPTATDNCAGTVTATTTDPLTYSTQGTYTITWTYDDGNGNTTTQTQTVIVDDTTAPVADVATLPTITAQCEVTAGTITAPTATDNCAGTVTATTTDPLTYSTQGTHTITWTYDDDNGNTTTQTQNVIIDDTTAPVADVATLPTITAQCEVTAGTITAPTATDNCAGTITATTTDPLTYSAQNGYTITWTYDDGNGNTTTQTQNVIVDDTTAPVADVATLPTITAQCEVTAGTITAPTATDNCAGTITATTTDPLTYSAQNGYTITWTYDDGNGNTTTQTQNVIVDDTTAPVADVATLPTITAQCEVTAGTIT